MKSIRERVMDIGTILVLLVAVSIFASQWLHGRRARSARQEAAAEAAAALLAARPDTLWVIPVGDTARRERLDFRSDSSTIVVLFTTVCPWCKQTRPFWESVAAQMPPGWRMLALTNEPITVDAAHYFTSPRVRAYHVLRPAESARLFPAAAVPVTAAVRGGRVLAGRIGFADSSGIAAVVAPLARR